MKYQNIASPWESFHRYYLLREYDSLEEAEKNLLHDVREFKSKHGKSAWFVMNGGISAYATIKAEA